MVNPVIFQIQMLDTVVILFKKILHPKQKDRNLKISIDRKIQTLFN